VDDVERVLIVGGGIGGLTLAAALHRDGRDVELVELEREWNTSGAGLSVLPNGLRVLKSLGLDAGVVGAGCVIGSWLFADDQGGVLCRIDLDGVWGGVGPLVGIARARLQDVLVAGAQLVPCRLGTLDRFDRRGSPMECQCALRMARQATTTSWSAPMGSARPYAPWCLVR
jgi:2-polyprenyl-6-methoxyphenol hydroxylase-like FAD-dependent oxidoreductase